MKLDEEITARLTALADGLPNEDAPVADLLARGGRARAVQWVAVAGVATALIAGLLVPLLLLLPTPAARTGDDSRGPTRVEIPSGGSAILPSGWAWTNSSGGEHAVLALATSTNRAAVVGLVEGDTIAGKYSVHSVDVHDLGPADAYVQVWIAYMVPTLQDISVPPLMQPLPISRFSVGERYLGRPVLSYQAYGKDGGRYAITFWIGPDAGVERSRQTRFVLDH